MHLTKLVKNMSRLNFTSLDPFHISGFSEVETYIFKLEICLHRDIIYMTCFHGIHPVREIRFWTLILSDSQNATFWNRDDV